MARYLVERYLPALEDDVLSGDIARLQATTNGEVRLLLTLYSPEDETCFHLFDASTPASVEDIGRSVGMPMDRIVPVMEIGWEEAGRGTG